MGISHREYFRVTGDQVERFHAEVKQKLDRHLNEYEGKFAMDHVGSYSVSSQHEQNQEDNQRRIMKINEELIELLQTELLTLPRRMSNH